MLNNKAVWCVRRPDLNFTDQLCSKLGLCLLWQMCVSLLPVQCIGAEPVDVYPAKSQRERFSVPVMGSWMTLQDLFINNLINKDILFLLSYVCLLVWFFKYSTITLVFSPNCLNILTEVTVLRKDYERN